VDATSDWWHVKHANQPTWPKSGAFFVKHMDVPLCRTQHYIIPWTEESMTVMCDTCMCVYMYV